jgi:hypothetical protein
MLPGPVRLHDTEEAPGTENVCEFPSATLAELGLTLRVGVGVGGGVLLPPPQATKPIRTKKMRNAEMILVITKLHPCAEKEIPLSIGRVAVKYRILSEVRVVIRSRRPKVIRIVKRLPKSPELPKVPELPSSKAPRPQRFSGMALKAVQIQVFQSWQFLAIPAILAILAILFYPMSSLKFSR